jgi:hypothetical protein
VFMQIFRRAGAGFELLYVACPVICTIEIVSVAQRES